MFRVKVDLLNEMKHTALTAEFLEANVSEIGGREPHGILNFPPNFPRKFKERSRMVMLLVEIES